MKSKRDNNKEMEKTRLKQEFLDDYRKFAQEFDLTAQDLFRGVALDELAKGFQRKHHSYLASLPYCAEPVRGQLPKDRESLLNAQTVREDLAILDSPAEQVQESEDIDNGDDPRYEKVLGGLYRRATEACYMRIVYNKITFDQDDDRAEPVQLGRHAIRYNPKSFHVFFWWMIAVGWKLEDTTGARDRITTSSLFSKSCRRTITLKPDDPLAYNLLGRYHFTCSGLNWLEKTIMQRVLGIKVNSTFELAERYFLKAHELKDDWPPTGLWMARVLLARGAPMAEVSKWIEFGLEKECLDPGAALERKEIAELKAKLKLSS